MNNNVVITIFEVESEAHQAFNELKRKVAGEGYQAPEAVLMKNNAGTIEIIDGYGFGPADAGTASGIVIGSLVGILGGPVGVILGAAAGGLVGNVSDGGRAVDTASVVAVVADKIYEGEIAIAALVSEEEPAFDAVFANFKTTIARYDAGDIAKDVDRLNDLATEISNQVYEEVKAERRAERKAKAEKSFEEWAEATNRTMGEAAPM